MKDADGKGTLVGSLFLFKEIIMNFDKFFESPFHYESVLPKISVAIKENELNDSYHTVKKKYTKRHIEIKFLSEVNDSRSWSQKAFDAVKDFIIENAVYKEKVKIIGTSFPKEYNRTIGIVYVECYILERGNL